MQDRQLGHIGLFLAIERLAPVTRDALGAATVSSRSIVGGFSLSEADDPRGTPIIEEAYAAERPALPDSRGNTR